MSVDTARSNASIRYPSPLLQLAPKKIKINSRRMQSRRRLKFPSPLVSRSPSKSGRQPLETVLPESYEFSFAGDSDNDRGSSIPQARIISEYFNNSRIGIPYLEKVPNTTGRVSSIRVNYRATSFLMNKNFSQQRQPSIKISNNLTNRLKSQLRRLRKGRENFHPLAEIQKFIK